MKVTEVQMRALWALDDRGDGWDPAHRPRGSLERLKKKGLVGGNKKSGWWLTDSGRAFLISEGLKTLRGNKMPEFRYVVDKSFME